MRVDVLEFTIQPIYRQVPYCIGFLPNLKPAALEQKNAFCIRFISREKQKLDPIDQVIFSHHNCTLVAVAHPRMARQGEVIPSHEGYERLRNFNK